MGLRIEYTPLQGGAALISCTGYGSSVHLPKQVDGLPLLEICPYAFSASGAAAEHLPVGTEIRCAKTGSQAAPGSTKQFLGGASLREITLPPSIRVIGEYAFYNCVSLSNISLGAGAARVGNGAFMNCGALGNIFFSAASDAETCLPGLLTEIQREVRVFFRCGEETSEWIFPEYYEESVENAPAHIFEHFIHGAGYRYRQCFQGNRLDAEQYDRQFPMAQVEGDSKTVLRIALTRLRHPVRLSETAEKQYLIFLKESADAAAGLLISDDDPEGLKFFAARSVFTQDNIDNAVGTAARAGRTECLSVLMNERHTRFAPKEKTFDL